MLLQQSITAISEKLRISDALLDALPDASPELLAHLYGREAPIGVYMLVDGSS